MRRLRAALFVLVVGALVIAPTMVAMATQPDPDHRVTICHRTASHTNPYVVITVDEAAINMDTGDDSGKGDHNAEHQGPIWFSGIQVEWGDIIPPFYEDGSPGYWPPLNWPDGQAIFENNCEAPGEYPAEPVEGDLASATGDRPFSGSGPWGAIVLALGIAGAAAVASRRLAKRGTK
jgi:hypothetical protein